MKNVFIALIAVVSTACVSNANTRLDALERRNAELAAENQRFRSDYVRRQQAAGSPADAPQTTQVVQGSTGAVWTRQKHGVYMGTVGAQSRQVTQGRKLQLDNQVCDKGSRDMWSTCMDTDDNGSPDLNTWLAFEIDGQPVVCDSGFYHPESKVSLLPPGQTCYVELGRSRTVKLTVKAYRNSGTSSYVMLDSTPFSSAFHTVSVGNRNILPFLIGEYSI